MTRSCMQTGCHYISVHAVPFIWIPIQSKALFWGRGDLISIPGKIVVGGPVPSCHDSCQTDYCLGFTNVQFFCQSSLVCVCMYSVESPPLTRGCNTVNDPATCMRTVGKALDKTIGITDYTRQLSTSPTGKSDYSVCPQDRYLLVVGNFIEG